MHLNHINVFLRKMKRFGLSKAEKARNVYGWFSGVDNTQPHWMVCARLLEFQDEPVSLWCLGGGTEPSIRLWGLG